MIEPLQGLSDKAGYLRDQSDRESQILLNDFKRELPTVWEILQKLDNQLSDVIEEQMV
jgi:hypothetical protein